MSSNDIVRLLREHGIRPSAQRVAIARYVLRTEAHPTADEVLKYVRRRQPFVSRATVYNTLNLLVEKGLLRHHVVDKARGVFDPKTLRHHHLVDEEPGTVKDIPWEDLEVSGLDSVGDYVITDYMVVVKGHRNKGRNRNRGRKRDK